MSHYVLRFDRMIHWHRLIEDLFQKTEIHSRLGGQQWQIVRHHRLPTLVPGGHLSEEQLSLEPAVGEGGEFVALVGI